MKRLIAKLTLTSLLITLSPARLIAGTVPRGNTDRGVSNPFLPGQGLGHKLPKHAVVGSTPERRAAWAKLSPEQRQDYLKQFEAALKDGMRAAADRQRAPHPTKPQEQWIQSNLLGKKIRSALAETPTRSGAMALTQRSGAISSYRMRPIEDPEPYPEPDPNPGSSPPEASVYATPTYGAAPLTVQFSSYAYDPDGWITNYYWDFGDGGGAYDANPIHTYTAPGVYTAWLTVIDNSGLSTWAAVNVSVTGGSNLPPAVAAGGSPLAGFAPLPVDFNASASDPDGWVASYYWDFGDGQSSNQAAPTHVYQTAGSYTATVTVTDNAGATASASVGVQAAVPSLSGTDADGDGLPDAFENALNDAFTPVYHLSGGEQAGTGFARFGDYVPVTVTENLPLLPPVTHVRVTPVGFATDVYGRQLGFLRIDYLTFLNRDDGLRTGDICRGYTSVIGSLIGVDLNGAIESIGQFDPERSAVLVAAPASGGFQYSTDPAAYQAYSYYTAAHENTFFDHSSFFSPSQPIPAYNHLNLALSRSKHSTYPFNPDYMPIMPDWVIYSTYATIDLLYAYPGYSDFKYEIFLYIADTVFFDCVVERFQDQGGWFPGLEINVGELSHPLNGSGFIFDDKVRSKLDPLWILQ